MSGQEINPNNPQQQTPASIRESNNPRLLTPKINPSNIPQHWCCVVLLTRVPTPAKLPLSHPNGRTRIYLSGRKLLHHTQHSSTIAGSVLECMVLLALFFFFAKAAGEPNGGSADGGARLHFGGAIAHPTSLWHGHC